MNDFCKIIEQLDVILRNIELKYEDNTLVQAEKGIRKSKETLKKIRDIITKKGFKTNYEEIRFFKSVKPQIYGRIIYYCRLITIENKRPRSGIKEQIKYLKFHIEKLQSYFNENLEFYNYYRRRSTHLDEHYFLRGKENLRLHPDNFHFLTDDEFSTSHDSTVATIIAYDMLIVYLTEEIEKLEYKRTKPNRNINQKIGWTGNKIDLVELIYALHSSDCVNYGKADIKDIAKITERIFNLELGDFYRAFLEIRQRKKGRTKFLNSLKENLIIRMNKTDD